ncbi:prepilin-type N-terminal cleavage/methylation domain-containing protein [Synechococcus moorigangaii CMS01]|nr:prepilin-type N-terminal cleavage/methylation domain-containing protein [Synechococcus moorigangaii CMS01]
MMLLDFCYKFIKFNRKTLNGFTLVELLLAITISGIIATALGVGLSSMLTSNRKVEAKTQQRTLLNRATDYITEDIKKSRVAGISTVNTTNDTLELSYFPNITSANEVVIQYQLDDQSDPWKGPKVLKRREGQRGSSGTTWGNWQVVVDGISENTTDIDCDADSGVETINTLGGFQACVEESDSDATVSSAPVYSVSFALVGELFDFEGNDSSDRDTLRVETQAFSRAVVPLLTPILTATANSKPLLTWSEPVTATGFEIYRCSTTSSTTPCDPETSGTLFYETPEGEEPLILTATEVTAPPDGERWCYSIRAVNENNNSTWSEPVCGTFPGAEAPGTPTSFALAINETNGNKELSWGAPTFGGAVSSYEVYRCQTTATSCDPSSGTSVYDGSSLSTTDNQNPALNSRWCYSVRATNASGSSSFVTPAQCTPIYTGTAPDVPTNFTVSNSPTPALNWDDMLGASSYQVYRCKVLSLFCTPTTSDGLAYSGMTSAAIDSEEPGVGYSWCYVVRATNNFGSSGLSTRQCAPTQPEAAPGRPNNVSATGAASPTVSWTAPSSGGTPDSYSVYRCQSDANTSCSPNTAGTDLHNSSSLSYTEITAPADKKKWCYVVTAKNTGGISLPSELVCGLPNNNAPVANDDAVCVDKNKTVDIAVLVSNTTPPANVHRIRTVADTDADGDTITLQSVSLNGLGSTSVNGNNVRYNSPNTNSNDSSITYTITDGYVTDTGTLTIYTRNSSGSCPTF